MNVQKLLLDLLLNLLSTTGQKWKTVTGLCLAVAALVIEHFVGSVSIAGVGVWPVVFDTGLGLAGVGVLHKMLAYEPPVSKASK